MLLLFFAVGSSGVAIAVVALAVIATPVVDVAAADAAANAVTIVTGWYLCCCHYCRVFNSSMCFANFHISHIRLQQSDSQCNCILIHDHKHVLDLSLD